MKNILAIFVVIVFLDCKVESERKEHYAALDKIDYLFAHISSDTPGYIVSVIQNSEYILNKCYGSANLEYGIPISAESAFNIASLSKQFTGASIALLILENKVSLEDNVKFYIPNFPDFAKEIKIKHLIYMTSGINDYYYNERENGTDWSSLNFFSIDSAIDASLSTQELMYPPGSKWSYSNINYMLLTKVVEKVSGMRFSDFVKQRLFDPLEMEHTFVNDDIFQVIPNRVNGYNHRDKENTQWLIESGYMNVMGKGYLQINRNSPHYGGSGVYSTMHDMKKWIDNFESKAFGGQPLYDLMHKTMRFEHDKTNDAFGLVFGEFKGHEIIWYEGGDWGFSNYMMRFPQYQLTIVCFSNIGTGKAQNFAKKVMQILIEEKIVSLN